MNKGNLAKTYQVCKSRNEEHTCLESAHVHDVNTIFVFLCNTYKFTSLQVQHIPQCLRGKEGRLRTSCITFEKEIQTRKGHNLLAPSEWHLHIMC